MTVMSWKLFSTQNLPRKNPCPNLSIFTEILFNLCYHILLDLHLSNNNNFIVLHCSDFKEEHDAAAMKHCCHFRYYGNHTIDCNQHYAELFCNCPLADL